MLYTFSLKCVTWEQLNTAKVHDVFTPWLNASAKSGPSGSKTATISLNIEYQMSYYFCIWSFSNRPHTPNLLFNRPAVCITAHTNLGMNGCLLCWARAGIPTPHNSQLHINIVRNNTNSRRTQHAPTRRRRPPSQNHNLCNWDAAPSGSSERWSVALWRWRRCDFKLDRCVVTETWRMITTGPSQSSIRTFQRNSNNGFS